MKRGFALLASIVVLMALAGTGYAVTTVQSPLPPSTPLAYSLPPLLPESTGPQLFVSPTGSGTACTQLLPCSMQQGINTATAGNRIEALGGTYNVNLLWDASHGNSGTATDPITLERFSGEAVVLHAATSNSEILRVGGNDFLRIKGLVIEATSTLWAGTGRQAFYISGGTCAPCEPLRSHDIDVLGNDFAGKDTVTGTGHDSTAFLAAQLATHINVVGNKVHDWGNGTTQQQGLHIQADSGMVANNVIYRLPNGFGIQLRAEISAVKPCDVIVTGNTVVDVPYLSAAGGHGISVENSCGGPLLIRNNISAFSYKAQEEIYGIYVAGYPPPDGANRAFTNLVWDTTGAHTGNTSGLHILAFTGSAPWDWTGPGSNTVADPLFVNRTGFDYHLQAGSPAIDQGDAAYALPFDFDGNPRVGAPDLGAYER